MKSKHEERALILLKATLDILKECDNGCLVKNALEVTAEWDDADCDGYCLMNEIEELLTEIKESKDESHI